jgi:hypothetical protein
MYNQAVNDDYINLIQTRIIELTNKKIMLEDEIRENNNIAERDDISYFKKQDILRLIKKKKAQLIELEKVLYTNKYLLNQNNEHEYQLEN